MPGKQSSGLKIDMDHEDGFTGLEAGIVLIAFLVVAAVFSFAILGSGFFATEKARSVTQDAGKSISAVTVTGSVTSQANDVGTALKRLIFYCEVTGEGVSASDIRYSLMTTEMIYEIPSSDGTISIMGEGDDGLLSPGEILRVELDIRKAALPLGTPFTLTIHPPQGIPVHVPCRVPDTVVKNKRYEVG
jgi:flagellin FlaB